MLSKSEQLEIHAILYAKGHYKVTDTITDLQQIIGKYSGMFPNSVSKEHIICFLSELNTKYNPKKYDYYDFIRHTFTFEQITPKYDQAISIDAFIKSLLGMLRYDIQAKHIKEWIEADPSILPLKESN